VKSDIQIRNVLCLFACTRFENRVITLFEAVWRIARAAEKIFISLDRAPVLKIPGEHCVGALQ